jgi:hypothetical protein
MQFDRLKRREFITLLGGATVAWPLAARAQQAKGPVRIGFLPLGSPSNAHDRSNVEAFQEGLRKAGLVEHRDIVLDIVWSRSHRYYPGRFGAPTTSQDTDLKDAVEFGCHGAFSSDPAGARPAPLEGEARRIATADKVCIPARRGDF